MTLKRSLVVGLAVLVLTAPAAEARSPFHLVGTGSVWTDGDRYTVLSDTDGVPYRIIDDRTRRSWRAPSAPPGCEAYLQVADGHLLWAHCIELLGDVLSSRPLLQNLETGAVTPVPGWDRYVSWFAVRAELGWTGEGPWPNRFGSRWLRAEIQCYHCGPEYSYIDWHAGRFVSHLTEVPKVLPDLETADLEVQLCAPLRRHRLQDAYLGNWAFEDSVYAPPWYMRDAIGRYVQLNRCGHHKPLRIHRCSALSACAPQLGGGFLTWSDPEWKYGAATIKVFRVADQRRVSIGKLRGADTVQHTARRVYVSTASGKVYVARLPRP
jgi:hypothetical protein